MFVGFCQMAASKAEQFSGGVQHCWPCTGESEREREKESHALQRLKDENANQIILVSQAHTKKAQHPDTCRNLREMISAAILFQAKTKGYWSDSSHFKSWLCLPLNKNCLWVPANAYKTAKRHNENRKHQINSHQGSKNKGIIRWLSESNRSCNNSIVCPQIGSHAELQEAQKARDTGRGKG